MFNKGGKMPGFERRCLVCGKKLKEHQQKYCCPSHRVKACRDKKSAKTNKGFDSSGPLTEDQWWFERIKEPLIAFLKNFDILNDNKSMKEFADKMRKAFGELKNNK